MNRLRRLVSLITVTTIVLLAGGAFGQCATDAESIDVGGTVRPFGYGYYSGELKQTRGGQSFFMECDAQLGSVTVLVRRPTTVNRDVEPVGEGDLLRCDVYDENRNLIMSDTEAYPVGGLSRYVVFTFWDQEFRLGAGTYQFLISTVEHRWAYLYFGDDYTAGAYQEEDILGNWGSLGFDSVFRAYWNEDAPYVANETRTFGTLKLLYR